MRNCYIYITKKGFKASKRSVRNTSQNRFTYKQKSQAKTGHNDIPRSIDHKDEYYSPE